LVTVAVGSAGGVSLATGRTTSTGSCWENRSIICTGIPANGHIQAINNMDKANKGRIIFLLMDYLSINYGPEITDEIPH